MPMDIRLRARVAMKKPHPCGEKIFEITGTPSREDIEEMDEGPMKTVQREPAA